MLSGRAGVTLIELMLATVAMLVVGAAVQRALQATQRLSRAQRDQVGLQASVRGAVLAVSNELRELGTGPEGTGAQDDLLSIGPAEVSYRAMRGTGFLCEPAPPGQLRFGRSSFSGHRIPQAGRDSVLVFYEPVPDARAVWVPAAVTSVSVGHPCPGTGNPSITLAIPVNDSITGAAAGTPIRLYEIMQLRLYRSGGDSWLGMRSVSAGESIQPLLGPLVPHSGFRLHYLDLSGSPALTTNAVRGIRVALTAEGRPAAGDALDQQGGRLQLHTQVTLRNVLH